jgi:CMP-N-acetylneuraminic acid synthetase
MKILVIIPARGDSKGFPSKNLYSLAGKPLIAFTIENALKVSGIEKVICSTDDKKIAHTASSFGCEVPFTRPAELAKDRAKLTDVVLHALDWFEERGEDYDVVITLQCTSPLRTSKHIEKALDQFKERKLNSLISVCEFEHPIYWAYDLLESNKLNPVFDVEKANSQRQSLPKAYRPNGAIFINDTRVFRKCNGFYNADTAAFVMDIKDSIDIDDKNDITLAEFLISKQERKP